jgi:hypothetical protein
MVATLTMDVCEVVIGVSRAREVTETVRSQQIGRPCGYQTSGVGCRSLVSERPTKGTSTRSRSGRRKPSG